MQWSSCWVHSNITTRSQKAWALQMGPARPFSPTATLGFQSQRMLSIQNNPFTFCKNEGVALCWGAERWGSLPGGEPCLLHHCWPLPLASSPPQTGSSIAVCVTKVNKLVRKVWGEIKSLGPLPARLSLQGLQPSSGDWVQLLPRQLTAAPDTSPSPDQERGECQCDKAEPQVTSSWASVTLLQPRERKRKGERWDRGRKRRGERETEKGRAREGYKIETWKKYDWFGLRPPYSTEHPKTRHLTEMWMSCHC